MNFRISVASLNPVKIDATAIAFRTMFPKNEIYVCGCSVQSGVPNQPLSDEETKRGAFNRAQAANKFHSKLGFHFWVGIESGVQYRNAFDWICIIGKSGDTIFSRSTEFLLPKKIWDMIENGMELGDANDVLFGLQNSKQQTGAIGVLTNNAVTRTSILSEAIILALIPFRNMYLEF